MEMWASLYLTELKFRLLEFVWFRIFFVRTKYQQGPANFDDFSVCYGYNLAMLTDFGNSTKSEFWWIHRNSAPFLFEAQTFVLPRKKSTHFAQDFSIDFGSAHWEHQPEWRSLWLEITGPWLFLWLVPEC
jgi:hypothetical protein